MPPLMRTMRSPPPGGGLGWIVLVTTPPAPRSRSRRMVRSWSVRSPEPTTTGLDSRMPSISAPAALTGTPLGQRALSRAGGVGGGPADGAKVLHDRLRFPHHVVNVEEGDRGDGGQSTQQMAAAGLLVDVRQHE